MCLRIWKAWQELRAYIEEKLGLSYQFESVEDRWKRKGLLREASLSRSVEKFNRETMGPIPTHRPRQTWDDILEAIRREPRDYRS